MDGRTFDGLGALLDVNTSVSGVKLLRADDVRGRCVAKASSAGDSGGNGEVGIAIAGDDTGSEGVDGCQS